MKTIWVAALFIVAGCDAAAETAASTEFPYQSAFRARDLDSDGSITQHEYSRDSEDRFASADKNRDASLDREEYAYLALDAHKTASGADPLTEMEESTGKPKSNARERPEFK